ncbi:hypothetical protein PR048_011294 [Dryococelus australis]|uniref:Uncharacterized protein n=1 Tax=Dryococelus australis TaxID=614101 RepID=A0ABQ9HMH4_9NEOP|nr:hypothetical protein PR048_011294 [Dryococelus australis]
MADASGNITVLDIEETIFQNRFDQNNITVNTHWENNIYLDSLSCAWWQVLDCFQMYRFLYEFRPNPKPRDIKMAKNIKNFMKMIKLVVVPGEKITLNPLKEFVFVSYAPKIAFRRELVVPTLCAYIFCTSKCKSYGNILYSLPYEILLSLFRL